ncbi:sigma-70 family RNA polymerase sigma factor [Streptomyces sp. NPDC026672]|uniref:sigma-70 family RNA polymerase sigma factor n=1 Tax=unclassified Streptomyces TaxID=2593676 RepID=UPI0033CCEEB5
MDGSVGGAAELLAVRFEVDRPHLTAVARRLLGSAGEADDAVQDAWLRARRADLTGVENLTGWLTTVVTRVCLNQLRTRRARREEPLEAAPERAEPDTGGDPAREALLADEVGVALLVVLDTLSPAERVAFVLHDMFAVPFEDIAPLVEKTPAATRQLASRARRRVRGRAPGDAETPGPGASGTPGRDPGRARKAVEAFLAATRGGNLEALVALLDPDVVLRADALVIPTPEAVTVRGAERVARGAMAAVARAQFTGLALLDGEFGLVMAPFGRLRLVLAFTVEDGLITGIDVVAEPARLAAVEIAAVEIGVVEEGR